VVAKQRKFVVIDLFPNPTSWGNRIDQENFYLDAYQRRLPNLEQNVEGILGVPLFKLEISFIPLFTFFFSFLNDPYGYDDEMNLKKCLLQLCRDQRVADDLFMLIKLFPKENNVENYEFWEQIRESKGGDDASEKKNYKQVFSELKLKLRKFENKEYVAEVKDKKIDRVVKGMENNTKLKH